MSSPLTAKPRIVSSYMDTLGKRLKAHIASIGETPPEFAARMGITRGNLHLILTDATSPRKMQAKTAIALARELGETVEQMIEGKRTKTRAEAQAENDVRALQIVTVSLVRALILTIPTAAKPFAEHALIEAAGTDGEPAFDPDYGVLATALGIAQQAIDRMAALDHQQLPPGSASKPK